jgi:hypothetical protein
MMKRILVCLDKEIILFLIPVDSSALFEDVHILILEEPDVLFKKEIRKTLPLVLMVECVNFTEFYITHQKPNKESSLVLIPRSGVSLINTRVVPSF